MTEDRRLIEDFLPIQTFSKEAARLESSSLGGDKSRQEPKLAESCRSYTPRVPAGRCSELPRIQNPAARLDHAKREIVAARFYQIPAEALEAARAGEGMR